MVKKALLRQPGDGLFTEDNVKATVLQMNAKISDIGSRSFLEHEPYHIPGSRAIPDRTDLGQPVPSRRGLGFAVPRKDGVAGDLASTFARQSLQPPLAAFSDRR
jgi:hypothetical protein